jgi:Tfp pilus assembly PilM family ATPase
MKTKLKKSWKSERVIGLDVDQGRIVASQFGQASHEPVLKKLCVGEYDPKASVRDTSKAIRSFWKKERLTTRTVQTCLRNRTMITRYFSYDNLSQDELPQALILEAEEALQVHSSEICIDWQIDQCDEDLSVSKPSKQLSGVFVATPKNAVLDHLKTIRDAGLYTIRVEPSCSALGNLYAFISKHRAPSPVCLVNLTARTADIIIRSGESNYPRTLFSANDNWENNLPYLLENVQNALLYYHIKLKNPAVDQILVTGRIPDSVDFIQKLHGKTSVRVDRLDLTLSRSLSFRKTCLTDGSCPDYNIATGIGLGLRRMDYDLV